MKALFVSGERPVMRLFANRVIKEVQLIEEIVFCDTVEDAIESLNHHEFVLVFTDNQIGDDPEFWGPRLLRHAKERNPEVKTMIMSGKPSEKVDHEKLNADKYLQKPFTSKLVISNARELLRISS